VKKDRVSTDQARG